MAMTNDFLEIVRSARAQRFFAPDAVDDSTIGQILEVAGYAPSGMNTQPWRFVVVREAERRRAIAALYRTAWERGKTVYGGGPARSPAEERMLAAVNHLAEHFDEAPVIIAVCLDRRALGAMVDEQLRWRDPAPVFASILPAVQNLILAARARGLGTVLTTLHRLREDDLRLLLGAPAEVEIVCLLPLGVPREPFEPVKRKPVARMAYRECWGVAW